MTACLFFQIAMLRQIVINSSTQDHGCGRQFSKSGKSGRKYAAWRYNLMASSDIELSGAVLRGKLQRGKE